MNHAGRSTNKWIAVAAYALLIVASVPSSMATSTQVTPQKAKETKPSPAAAQGTVSGLHRSGYVDTVPSPARLAELQQLKALIDLGRAREQAHDYAGAASAFTSANALEPQDKHALYGLAECAGATGDIQGELDYYRRAIYTSAPVPYAPTLNEGNVLRLMQFVLLLDKTDQAEEAVSVYNQGVALLDFDAVSGKQTLEVLLPQFGDGLGQAAYAPQRLEAMAHVAMSLNSPPFDMKQLREAVALAPDSAVAQYYLGKALYAFGDNKGAKAPLEQAVALGDDQTVAAAKAILQFVR